MLPNIISLNQGAFVPERQLFDNSMVATMKNRRQGRNMAFALKLDMSKAYDRVEWDYLKKMMTRLGFSSAWIKWVMMCVKSVPYSIVING